MVEKRVPITNKVAGMILTHKNDQGAHHVPGGVDVKSGFKPDTPDNGWFRVTFYTEFNSIPHVVAVFADYVNGVDIICVDGVTTTGFNLSIIKGHGGAAHRHDIYWIATDAGNP